MNPVFVHTGRTITITKQKAYFTQCDYVKSLRRIYLERNDNMKNIRPLENAERTALRAGIGKVIWIVRGTNPCHAYSLAKQLQCLKRSDSECIHDYNRLCSQIALDEDFAYVIHKTDIFKENFKVVVHGDSGFQNAGLDKTGTQAGFVFGCSVGRRPRQASTTGP